MIYLKVTYPAINGKVRTSTGRTVDDTKENLDMLIACGEQGIALGHNTNYEIKYTKPRK